MADFGAGSSAMSIAGNRFEEYKCCANDVINFKLVRNESEVLSEETSFKPDMSHQLFGDSENIFGYKDLKIDIYCTASRMITYINISYSDKINPQKCDGVSADDITKVLNEHLQPGFLTSKDAFISELAKDATFKPFGELVHSYNVTKETESRDFEIYKHSIDVPGFREYHERIQPFLLFYVDAASFIDVDDERWTYYVLYEKYRSDGNPMYAFVGYATIYNYYAYPTRTRPRISQVLVMPPFQRQGHGATIIQTFYNDCYVNAEKIQDITVEDPSENFQRVRDFVDARNCMKLASFHPDKLVEGFSDDMINEAREKLLINKKQARRVYEILRLKVTDRSNPADARSYRLDVKKRLNLPFQKTGRDFKKLEKALKPNELSATLNNLSLEQRLEYLEKAFNELVEEYRHVVERLAIS